MLHLRLIVIGDLMNISTDLSLNKKCNGEKILQKENWNTDIVFIEMILCSQGQQLIPWDLTLILYIVEYLQNVNHFTIDFHQSALLENMPMIDLARKIMTHTCNLYINQLMYMTINIQHMREQTSWMWQSLPYQARNMIQLIKMDGHKSIIMISLRT